MMFALLLGFMGSFHCIGMCGPIALTLPVQHLSGPRKIAGIFLYNFGRIVAYMCMGVIFGWLGKQFFLGGLQQWLSISLGVLLLLVVLFQKRVSFFPQLVFVKKILGKLLAQQRFSTLFGIGFFNGFLPCGLVYLGIAGALATGGILHGMLFMGAFGAGTLPAMMAVTWFSQLISIPIRQRIRQMIPVMITIMAVLLILRGLNLGIPYVSPVIEAQNMNACHATH
jgi:sulfite exporter TauE/SafE